MSRARRINIAFACLFLTGLFATFILPESTFERRTGGDPTRRLITGTRPSAAGNRWKLALLCATGALVFTALAYRNQRF